jgi:hypothetical protein
MKTFISLDPADTESAMQTPLEEYPGFLGYQTDDGFLVLSVELDVLNELNWPNYFKLLDEMGNTVKVSLTFDDKKIEFDMPGLNDSLPNILDLIPAIEVHKDFEYGYHIFFLKQFHTTQDVEIQVGALVTAIKDENKKMNINL